MADFMLADQRDAAVGRSAIDHDVFIAGGEVVAHGLHCLAEIAGHIEIDGDDGNPHGKSACRGPRPALAASTATSALAH